MQKSTTILPLYCTNVYACRVLQERLDKSNWRSMVYWCTCQALYIWWVSYIAIIAEKTLPFNDFISVLKKTGISTPEGKTNISWEQHPLIKQPTIEISASGKIATFHDNTFLHVIGLFKGLLLSMSPLVLLDSLTQGKSFLSDFYRFFSCCYC